MKLTLEQRTWIERQMWPAAAAAVQAYRASDAPKTGGINSEFEVARIGIARNAYDDDDVVTVVYDCGNISDGPAEAWLTDYLRKQFPGVEIMVRTEW